ncbi:hypothetical protein CLOM_g4353 [Closterium sp. NIES-68]|nr:hypothetical protein CLOM_g18215 [Closterium sp. NIES-68]GJP44956.1 hypothetical protein CLOM_g4353 [Closterium sp. NIES-68]GJP83724.1 hypothetical protein CLOP_g13846 [Closterium sp. NIES-67]
MTPGSSSSSSSSSSRSRSSGCTADFPEETATLARFRLVLGRRERFHRQIYRLIARRTERKRQLDERLVSDCLIARNAFRNPKISLTYRSSPFVEIKSGNSWKQKIRRSCRAGDDHSRDRADENRGRQRVFLRADGNGFSSARTKTAEVHRRLLKGVEKGGGS